MNRAHLNTGNPSQQVQAGLEPDVAVSPAVENPSPGARPVDSSPSTPIEALTSRNESNRDRITSDLGPIRVAAALIGATTAMTTGAMAVTFSVMYGTAQDSSPLIASSVAGTAMIALSLGVRLPQRIAVWVCANAWRRVVSRGDAAPLSELHFGDLRTDRHLYWTVLSVIGLGSGVLVAMLPVTLRIAAAGYAWSHSHFLWPPGPLALLQATIIFASALLPIAALGIAVSCMHHLSCPFGRWETSATAWLIIGAAVGAAAFAALLAATLRTDLLLISGALPALILALVAAIYCTRRETLSDDLEDSRHPPVPISGLRRPRIVRIGIVGATCTAVCLIGVAYSVAPKLQIDRLTILTLLLLATGLGALAGCRNIGKRVSPRESSSPSIEMFGTACLCAGVLAVLSTIGFGFSNILPAPIVLGAALVATSSSGLAMTYGRRALIQRVASRSDSGALILARTLMYAGLTVWIFTPTAERVAGAQAPPLLLALVILVVGGMLSNWQFSSIRPRPESAPPKIAVRRP